MGLPQIDSRNKAKPLCYDVNRNKFIMYDEIISGKEKIIPVANLSREEQKILVIERIKKGPDFTMQTMTGSPMDKNAIIDAIIKDEDIGKMTLEAEISMLSDLLREIAKNLF